LALNTEAAALAAKINKELGEGAVVVAADMRIPRTFTSGSLSLDIALGGGWPGNQWVEIIGRESHGKTAVVLKTIAANQALDPNFTALWVAAEHYDKEQAAALGVDNDRVIVVPTQDMVIAYDTMLKFADSRSVDCIVLDSYPALIAPEEEQKDMDEVQVALGARVTGKFFRKAGSATRRSTTEEDRPLLGMIINQYRDKIGGFSPVGTPQTTPGGNAKNYAFYCRVEVKRDEWIEESVSGKNLKVKVGQTIKVKTIKNKQAPPQQVAVLDFYFRDAPQNGFFRGEYDTVKELVTLAILYDVIQRKGAYFNFGSVRWQGREAMLQGVREDLDLRHTLDTEVRQIALSQGPRELEEDAVDAAATAGVRTVQRRAKDEVAT
jgi:recombination protein RecA